MWKNIKINVLIFFVLIYLLLVMSKFFWVVFNFVGTLFDIAKVVKVVKTLSNIEFTKPPNLEGKNISIIFYTISINTNT
jgi:hypothetical protein